MKCRAACEPLITGQTDFVLADFKPIRTTWRMKRDRHSDSNFSHANFDDFRSHASSSCETAILVFFVICALAEIFEKGLVELVVSFKR